MRSTASYEVRLLKIAMYVLLLILAPLTLLAQLVVHDGSPTKDYPTAVIQSDGDRVRFVATAENPIKKAIGTPTEHDPCDESGIELRFGDKGPPPVTIKESPWCGRFCVDIPAGYEPADHTGWVRECTDQTWHAPCPDSGGVCPVQWVRLEGLEWYADVGRACIKVKNWSGDRNRCFMGEVEYRRVTPLEAVTSSSNVSSARGLDTKKDFSAEIPREHIVRQGETLAAIAQHYYGSQRWPRIYEANRRIVRDPDRIFPGQRLLIP